MKNSFNFFQNKDCEFFPCHRVEDEDSFNCLFCYCPLYFDEHCIGDPKYVVNGNGQRIRDCSDCEKVHDPAFYQCMMDSLRDRMKWCLLMLENSEKRFRTGYHSWHIGKI